MAFQWPSELELGQIVGSARELINGFAAKLDAAKTDPAALAALSAELKASDDDLAACSRSLNSAAGVVEIEPRQSVVAVSACLPAEHLAVSVDGRRAYSH